MVYILLADGFEEIEALALCDVLRRGGVETALCAAAKSPVTGGHGISVAADIGIDDIDLSKAELVAVPGGMGGVKNLLSSPKAMETVKNAYDAGVLVAAICAGPAVLAKLGITGKSEITAYPGLDDMMGGAKVLDRNVVCGDGFITGRAPGAAVDFALAVLEELRGSAAAEDVAAGMCYGRG